MKKITILLLFIGSFSFSQDLVWDKEKSFDVEFEIDNVYSSDGINWEITVSGQAGPYGMGYGSITFKNLATDNTQGEYIGYFLTQVADQTFRGSTSGLWKKSGTVYKTVAFDNDVVGSVINLATGTWDLINRKVNFGVAPLK